MSQNLPSQSPQCPTKIWPIAARTDTGDQFGRQTSGHGINAVYKLQVRSETAFGKPRIQKWLQDLTLVGFPRTFGDESRAQSAVNAFRDFVPAVIHAAAASLLMSLFDEFEQFQRFREAWKSIKVERVVEYNLFTFGDSDLPYFLVTSGGSDRMVKVRRGSVTISRARIITPDSMHPELRNFFDEHEDTGLIEFLMSRTAAFSNLKLSNQSGPTKIVTDTVEEAVAKLNRQLDDEDEDRIAILSAPDELAGFAIFRYASEKVMSSAPGNIQELREKGFLP